MRHLHGRVLPLLAALLALGAAPPLAAAGEEPPPPPKAPPPAEESAPAKPPAVETMDQAWRRLEALRQAPLAGPGSLPRRMEKLKALADQAMAIHARTPASGEDLYHLAEICMDAERTAEAAAFAGRYLEAGGKVLPPSAGRAHAVRVRALAAGGKVPEAVAALKAYREAVPRGEGIPFVMKAVGDAMAVAGTPLDALSLYREAWDLLPRPVEPGTAGIAQILVETLAALGRVDEARRTLEKAVEDAGGNENLVGRFQAIHRRIDRVGRPFEPPAVDRWPGGAAVDAAALRGKVAVWHFFAWWMEARSEDLDDWFRRSAALAPKGLVLLPVTRTAGWDPKTRRLDPGARTPEAECIDVEAVVRGKGWKGPLGVSFGGALFESLAIRALPVDIVVGRDGKVRFLQAGSEAGHALAVWAAERALAEPEAPPAAEVPGDPPPVAPAGEPR